MRKAGSFPKTTKEGRAMFSIPVAEARLRPSRRISRAVLALLVVPACAMLGTAYAQTGSTGGGQPFSNYQPTLTVTQAIATNGIFPARSGGGQAFGDTIGFVYSFAGDYAPPTGSFKAQG